MNRVNSESWKGYKLLKSASRTNETKVKGNCFIGTVNKKSHSNHEKIASSIKKRTINRNILDVLESWCFNKFSTHHSLSCPATNSLLFFSLFLYLYFSLLFFYFHQHSRYFAAANPIGDSMVGRSTWSVHASKEHALVSRREALKTRSTLSFACVRPWRADERKVGIDTAGVGDGQKCIPTKGRGLWRRFRPRVYSVRHTWFYSRHTVVASVRVIGRGKGIK